jgi:flagellar assembly protein FliH
MPSSRVLRPTRILPDTFQVVVPEGAARDSHRPDLPEGAAGPTPEEEVKDLSGALQRLEERWDEREKEYADELRRVEAEARRSAEKLVEETVSGFTSVVDDFLAQREEMFRTSEESVVRLSMAIARRVIGEEISANSEAVLNTVRGALKHILEKEHVVIRVHPEDLRVVREHASEWLGIVEGTRSLEIEEDERIRRGGCLVETESGNVEAQIEKQLQTLEKSLLEKVR